MEGTPERTIGNVKVTTDIGPAAFLSALQIAITIGGGVWFVASTTGKVEQSERNQVRLESDVKDVKIKADAVSDRVIKLETIANSVASTLSKLDNKLDDLQNAVSTSARR